MRLKTTRQAGFSLLELIITLGIMAILVGAIVPITRQTIKREKEIELKRNLRDIRQAIDRYHYDCEQGVIDGIEVRELGAMCYPPKLDILVDGVKRKGTNNIKRYLRRIPSDPFTGKPEWGQRAVEDDPTSTSWGGKNVYDVYSQSEETPLNGKGKYKDW